MNRISYRTAPAGQDQKVPGVVLAAGIIWIIVGAPIVLLMLVPLLLVIVASGQLGGAGAVLVLVSLLVGLFGAVFVSVGVRTFRGLAADTLGNGIGSILFGLLMGGLSLDLQHGGAGLLLIVAGVLALVGRSDYQAWKASRSRSRRPIGFAGYSR